MSEQGGEGAVPLREMIARAIMDPGDPVDAWLYGADAALAAIHAAGFAVVPRARIAELESEVARVNRLRHDAAWITFARGFAAAREAAAAALSRLTAQWPHVGPVPPTVRGEWALRALLGDDGARGLGDRGA